jgi:hypothetical protein
LDLDQPPEELVEPMIALTAEMVVQILEAVVVALLPIIVVLAAQAAPVSSSSNTPFLALQT